MRGFPSGPSTKARGVFPTLRLCLVAVALFFFPALSVEAQVRFAGKVETGYLHFQQHMVDVDPGHGWKGRYLQGNGWGITTINGINFANNHLFAGLGLGYLHFEGIHVASAFADFEYLPFNTRFTPLLNLKLGYSHLWNQYEGGTQTLLAAAGIGVNYQLKARLGAYLKSGVALTQQAQLVPITLGFRY